MVLVQPSTLSPGTLTFLQPQVRADLRPCSLLPSPGLCAPASQPGQKATAILVLHLPPGLEWLSVCPPPRALTSSLTQNLIALNTSLEVGQSCPLLAWPGAVVPHCCSITAVVPTQPWVSAPHFPGEGKKLREAERAPSVTRAHSCIWFPGSGPALGWPLSRHCLPHSHKDSPLLPPPCQETVLISFLLWLFTGFWKILSGSRWVTPPSDPGVLETRLEIAWPNAPILQMGKPRPMEGGLGARPSPGRGAPDSAFPPRHSTSPSSPRATRPWCTTWRSSSARRPSRASPTSVGPATPR